MEWVEGNQVEASSSIGFHQQGNVHKGSKVLKLERKSLEYLLGHFCEITANKEYQTADWRLRPLPESIDTPLMELEANKNDLLKFWPDLRTDNFIESKSLWKDQWKKFGSCYNLMPDDYIVYALNSRKRNDLKKILTSAGIVPSGSSYPTRRILQAFRKVMGVNVNIICEPDRNGYVYFAEVHQCVDVQGTTPIDCDNKAIGCDDDPIYPYMGFQPDKDPK